MNKWKTIADIRREYGNLSLSELNAIASPISQFEQWFAEVLETEKSDPTAMVLSTVDELGHPDSRVVLLKGLEDDAFVFYTNYQSAKALHILKTPFVALNFYWPQMARQVRIRGQVEQTTSAQSDAYFSTRPKLSQLSALSSPQSQIVEDRSVLETRLNAQVQKYQESPVPRPEHWGGYKVVPDEIEFWQGRDNRLHDRLHYKRYNNEWRYHRLAP